MKGCSKQAKGRAFTVLCSSTSLDVLASLISPSVRCPGKDGKIPEEYSQMDV